MPLSHFIQNQELCQKNKRNNHKDQIINILQSTAIPILLPSN